MAVKFCNNFASTLSSGINSSATTISVASAAGLPSLSGSDYLYLTIDTDTGSPTREIVKVTAISSNDLTVVRGQDGTSATSFDAGTKIELRVTAAALHESVSVAVDDLVDSAPGALDTLNELAAALGDDANFSTTVTNSIATKVPLAGGTMTGNLTVPNLSVTSTNWLGWGDYGERIAGSNAASKLYFYTDATLALTLEDTQDATFAGHVSLADSKELRLGGGDDLKLYHNGNHSYIKDAGTGDLYIAGSGKIEFTNADVDETYAIFNDDGTVVLKYDNSTKLSTSAGGVTITGALQVGTYDAAQLKVSGYSSTYRSIMLGVPDHNGGTVSLAVDVSANSGSNFAGQNQAFVGKNGLLFPNNAGSNWIGGIARGTSSDVIHVGPATSGGITTGPLTLTSTEAGIGLTSPTSPLTVKSDSTSSSDSGITLQGNGNTNAIFKVGEKSTDGGRLHMYDGGTEKIALYTDGTANHISAGQLLVGHSTSQAFVWSSVQPQLQIEGTDASSSSLSITRNDNGGSPPYLILAKSRGTSVNSNTVVQDDDGTGSIMFVAADGTDRLTRTATIDSYVDGTPGSNDTPGRLVFSTTSDGSASPTTALTIDSSQNATFAGNITFGDNHTIGDDGSDNLVLSSSSGEDIIIDANNDLILDHASGSTDSIYLRQAGTTYGYFRNSSDDLLIGAQGNNHDIYFQGNDGGTTINMLKLDAGDGGDATFSGHIELADSKYLKLGADADFIIYHDGTSNYVQAAKQDSDIIFRGNDGGTGTNMLTLDTSAAGEATFNAGATFGGNVGVSSGAISLSSTDLVFQVGSSSHSTPTIQIRSGTSGKGQLWFGDNSGTDVGRYDGYIEYDQSGQDFRIGTASTERMRLNATGLGIGTTSPSSLLHLASASSPTLRIVDTTNDATLLAYAQDSEAIIGTYSTHNLGFFTDSGRTLTLDTSHNATFVGQVTAGTSGTVVLKPADGSGNTSIEIQAATGKQAYLDLGGADVTDYSARIISDQAGGTGTQFIAKGGLVLDPGTGAVHLKYGDTEKLATSSSGVTVTGNATVNEGGEPNASGTLLLQANSSSRQIRIAPPSNAANGYIDYRGGNLLIKDDGTEVARFQGSTSFNLNGKLQLYTTDDQAHYYAFYTHTDDTLRINYDNSGNDEFLMNSSGDLSTTGTITASQSNSDIRLKENIQVISDAVSKVKSLRGVTFNFKESGEAGTGLIAQEVQEVLPEAVYTAPPRNEGDDFLALHYGNTVGLLIEAIKEQQAQIEALTKRLEEVEG